MEYYARSAGETGERQRLRDHLRAVAARAGDAAEAAGLEHRLGHLAGLLHDLGKYSDEFQEHLLREDVRLVEHAAHGAALAASASAVELAFAVAGHHSGLGSRTAVGDLLKRPEKTAGLPPESRVMDRARALLDRARADGAMAADLPRTVIASGDELTLELRIRMLLSCLADADRLDSEAWMDSRKPELRRGVRELDAQAGLTNLQEAAEALARGAPEGEVKRVRSEVFAACVRAGSESPGFFSLTVPTGGGKTLSSLAFALAHARAHGMRRVIFVLPFLAIIEQNAQVIRDAVGDLTVLEHHSGKTAVEDDAGNPDLASVRRRLLAENWDAPIIVTTTVQFFQSLFSNHPTDLRKIHNIARAVVVFDETQTFPPEMLRPLVRMLQQLKDEYRCSFVFCTATQPAFGREIRGAGVLAPLIPRDEIREIAPTPESLFARLRRVEVDWPTGPDRHSSEQVAAAMAASPLQQALAVVNTKKQAANLFSALRKLDSDAIHLSTRLCSAHRNVILAGIRERLRAQRKCLVAATQLVEAGVDIDFPAVWRAFGPLDSIAQAAGRCNREGARAVGRVTVFFPEDEALPGDAYRRATAVTQTMLNDRGAIDIHDPDVYAEYFQRFYNVSNLDAKNIDGSRKALDFPQTAADFKVIDSLTTAVLVPYGEGRQWIRRVETATEERPIGRRDLRQMQQFMVGLYPGELTRAVAAGAVQRHDSTGIHFLGPGGRYDEKLGLVLPDDPLEN